MRRFLPILPFALLAALSCPAFADSPGAGRIISIEGMGTIDAPPDTALINVGVTSDATTAREALDANTQAMGTLVSTLKAAGIEPKDIQTTGFSVSPQYFYPDRDANGGQPPPRITGYEVRNGVNAKVRKLDSLGSVLDQVVTAGANTINGVSFSVDDPDKLFDQARKAAFADARQKAGIYTDAAGVALGDVLSISETPNVSAPQPTMFRATLEAAAPAAAVPVEAGQLTYGVVVDVQWALKASP